MRVVGGTLAGIVATVALAACSPGYREAVPPPPPAPTAPASSSPAYDLAEEDALRAMFTYEPTEIRASLDRESVRAGGRFRVTGSSDCAEYSASLLLDRAAVPADARPLAVRASGTGAFTIDGVVPRGTPPQDVGIEIVTACGGPPETMGALFLRLRVTA